MKNFTKINNTIEIELQHSTDRLVHALRTESDKAGHGLCPPMLPLAHKSITGMDTHFLDMPGIVTFQKLPAAKQRVAIKKEYMMVGGKYVEISEEYRIELNTKKDKVFRTATVNMTSGQMDDSDFKCYRCLERYLYQIVNNNSDLFQDETLYMAGSGYIDIAIDSVRQFSISALGYSAGNSYDIVNRFFDKITGIFITYGDNIEDTRESSIGGYSVKVSPNARLKYRKTPYKPFGTLEMKGSKSKRIITIGIHKDYVSNLMNGNCKLYYNEHSLKIDKPISDYLFRLLIMRDKHKKIFYSYNELVNHLGIKKEKFKYDAAEQIAEIARGINYDVNNRIVMYTNVLNKNGFFSENRPFAMLDRHKNNKWVFVFMLNIGASPEQKIDHDNEELQNYLDDHHMSKTTIAKMQKDAKEMGLTMDEYVSLGFAANLLSVASQLADKRDELVTATIATENKKRKRKTKNEAYQAIVLGRELIAVTGGFEPGKEAIKTIEAETDVKFKESLAALKERNEENEKANKRQAFSALLSGRKGKATQGSRTSKTTFNEAIDDINDVLGLN